MTFRLLIALAFLLLPVSGHATDCVTPFWDSFAQGGGRFSFTIKNDSSCGALTEVYRNRNDPRPSVEIWARYVEFDPAATAGERRFNEWIKQIVGRLQLTGPIVNDKFDKSIAEMNIRVLDVLIVKSVYRSKRLLSALIENDFGCGAHCGAAQTTLNIDSETGQNIALGELVNADATASRCWEQFRASSKGGDFFAQRYDKTKFTIVDRWSASDGGITLHYGELLDYTSGWFECEISTSELTQLAKPGVSIPF